MLSEKEQLFVKLDECLLAHAKNLGIRANLQIADVYWLQGLAWTHHYLKNIHQFDSLEAETLLRFGDPLAVANHCREGNTHKCRFPICELLQETKAWDLFELAKPARQKPLSLLEQLDAAMKAVKEAAAPMERPKGGEAR